MPIEVGIWRMGDDPKRIGFEAVAAERDVEDVIAADISMLDPDLMLIGRQVPTGHGKFIDLLAMDREGKLVVIELKRDRTPRDVVAQILDYGSWVEALAEDEIAQVFEAFLSKHRVDRAGRSLDEEFTEHFSGAAVPEVLNESHELLIVATELDDSTERIINYLTGYGVAINAVFFRFFRDGDREYLTRAWLVEPEAVEMKVAEGREKLPWNGEYYVSFGHNPEGRHWDDARKYGFISAGGGEWYTRTLKILEPGGRVWVNVPNTGYVGVGIVRDRPMLPEQLFVKDDDGTNGMRLTEAPLKGNLSSPADNLAGTEEYIVPIKWLKTVPLAEAVSEKGLFGNQNSAARPRAESWRHTVDRLKLRFDISEPH